MISLSIGITGVLAYDNIYVLKGPIYEQRFKDLNEFKIHMCYKTKDYQNIELVNYNLLDDEWNDVSGTLDGLKEFHGKYKEKHKRYAEKDYLLTLMRYAKRYLNVDFDKGIGKEDD